MLKNLHSETKIKTFVSKIKCKVSYAKHFTCSFRLPFLVFSAREPLLSNDPWFDLMTKSISQLINQNLIRYDVFAINFDVENVSIYKRIFQSFQGTPINYNVKSSFLGRQITSLCKVCKKGKVM